MKSGITSINYMIGGNTEDESTTLGLINHGKQPEAEIC
jgi:hypothetical protein